MTPYRNDQARMDSEAASRAIADREERNTRLMVVWVEAIGLCALGVGFVAAISYFAERGLFSFLSSNQ